MNFQPKPYYDHISTEWQALQVELDWITSIIEYRCNIGSFSDNIFHLFPVPVLPSGQSDAYARLIEEFRLDPLQRLVLILSLCPYFKPDLTNRFLVQKDEMGMIATEIGGYLGKAYRGFLPTVQTALFLLSGNRLIENVVYLDLFIPGNTITASHLFKIIHTEPQEPFTSSLLSPTQELLQSLVTGKPMHPVFSSEFPAQRISTGMEWDDLVLNDTTLDEVYDVIHWIKYSKQLMSNKDFARKNMPGYRCLFSGPPGTGKTLTASLIGKTVGKETYKIDLSMVVSKYIGETEKNLAHVFDRAQGKDWILFFDEADALFGKRSETKDAHDRYANQEVAFLLQRIEQHDGIVILSSNYKKNIDAAFYRRIQSIINFPLPQAQERLLLWKKAIPEGFAFAQDLDLKAIAERYKLAGGAIMNVIRYGCLKAVVREDQIIELADLQEGISRELDKEGKMA
ncbi:ATP-binding protein [Rhodocytophaga rosea]|uniref:ATP-binding protein n=1 Tax=Rhodocytophaga rosea TaxID=2704465 RepID=A0A6C0GR06_9BACT|nr:ATP-binding protein [Rhodocytophaga rosea]QHT70499.1 ATP-binding protein [Rhodocytophaga rosea]